MAVKKAGVRVSAGKGAKRAKAKPRTAARKTEKTRIASPYETGTQEVRRVVDTILVLRRKHVFGDREKLAADTYRDAFEACPSSIRCALDVGVGGGNPSMRSPAEASLAAAGKLMEAARLLGMIDGEVVRRVCGEGQSLRQVAGTMFDGSERDDRMVGHRLREALKMLAKHWFPVRGGIRSERSEDAVPAIPEQKGFRREVLTGETAHARFGQVDRGGGE